MSWKKLTDPTNYGAEEYFILSLIAFIIFVILKHLIYHTVYYWWYRKGRLHIPARFLDIYTRKSLPQRLYEFVEQKELNTGNISSTLETIESFCVGREFALTLGSEKGTILQKTVVERLPKVALVCHSLCGYSVLHIIESSPDCHVYVIEPDKDKCLITEKMADLVGKKSQVTVIRSNPIDVIPKLGEDYGIDKLDFVFLTCTALQPPVYHDILKLLESSGHFHKQVASSNTVILADKVVHFEEGQFLKLVRYSEKYKTEYYQMPLEYSPDDITDGMEKAVYVG